jgi:hypothetical protein
MSTNRMLVTTLALCAAGDAAAAPIPVNGKGHPPAAIIALVLVLAAVTAYAAFAVARGRRGGRPLAWGTRVIDVIASAPAFAGGAVPAVAATVVIGLSLFAIVLLVRTRRVVSVATS